MLQGWFFWGMLCLILEVVTTSVVFLCLAISCLPAVIMSFFSASFTVQLFVYGVSVFVAFYWVKPVLYALLFNGKERIKTNAEALVGKRVKVIENICPDIKGRVKISGDKLQAVSIDNSEILTGQMVTVEKVESNFLVVSK